MPYQTTVSPSITRQKSKHLWNSWKDRRLSVWLTDCPPINHTTLYVRELWLCGVDVLISSRFRFTAWAGCDFDMCFIPKVSAAFLGGIWFIITKWVSWIEADLRSCCFHKLSAARVKWFVCIGSVLVWNHQISSESKSTRIRSPGSYHHKSYVMQTIVSRSKFNVSLPIIATGDIGLKWFLLRCVVSCDFYCAVWAMSW